LKYKLHLTAQGDQILPLRPGNLSIIDPDFS